MSFWDEYVCVEARFLFFNGKKEYTVEFSYGLNSWFVFNDHETSGCIYQKNIITKVRKTPARDSAADILEEYFESIKNKQ